MENISFVSPSRFVYVVFILRFVSIHFHAHHPYVHRAFIRTNTHRERDVRKFKFVILFHCVYFTLLCLPLSELFSVCAMQKKWSTFFLLNKNNSNKWVKAIVYRCIYGVEFMTEKNLVFCSVRMKKKRNCVLILRELRWSSIQNLYCCTHADNRKQWKRIQMEY